MRAGLPVDGVHHPAGDAQRTRQRAAVTDRGKPIRRRDAVCVDDHAGAGIDDRGVRDHPHAGQLHRLRAGVAKLLDRVDKRVGPHSSARVVDDEHDARPTGGDRAGQHAENAQPVTCLAYRRGTLPRTAAQPLLSCLEIADLGTQPVSPVVEIRQDAEEVVDAGRLQSPTLRRRVNLRHEPEGEQTAQGGHHELPARRLRPQRDEQAAAVRRHAVWCVGAGHARKRWRRMAAAFEKIRMPRTTTIAVDSSPPTPSLSPTKTISAATRTLDTKETTKTFSSKIRSSQARTPPNNASSAATTAIGRYGCRSNGTVGCSTRPSATPSATASATITAGPPPYDVPAAAWRSAVAGLVPVAP